MVRIPLPLVLGPCGESPEQVIARVDRVILRDRKFADSSLEGAGFEPSVPVKKNRSPRRRSRVKTSFKRVSAAAKAAGVRDRMQPIFHDARYRGLYGAPLKAVRRKKGIPETENMLDRAGPLELRRTIFR